MQTIVWLPKGEKDIARLLAFVIEQHPAAAKKILHAVEAATEKLQQFPDMGKRLS